MLFAGKIVKMLKLIVLTLGKLLGEGRRKHLAAPVSAWFAVFVEKGGASA